ncbi:MAG: glycosyltransferase, partial [Flavobacteriales bacterium]
RHKGIFNLWNAFIELQNENPSEWELWCLGTGEEFENRILHPKIKHFGFIQPLEINKYLSQAGVYILPSIFEPWGVSVHEMAAAGFPMLLSKNVGSSEEFLEENINGYHFSSVNKFEIKQKLKKIINLNDSDLLTMGNKSFNLSLKNSPKIWAEKLISLL